MVSQAFFAVGVALLSLLAYFVQDDWRHLTQGATLLGIPFVFLITFVLPESPRWLQSQGRTKAAVKVMQHIAAKNGAQWSSEIVTPAVTTEIDGVVADLLDVQEKALSALVAVE